MKVKYTRMSNNKEAEVSLRHNLVSMYITELSVFKVDSEYNAQLFDTNNI